MRKHTLQKCVLFIALLLALPAAFFAYFWHWLSVPVAVADVNRVVTVPSGASVKSVSSGLYEKGLIKYPKIWQWYARVIASAPIKVGEFELPEHASPRDILAKLQSTDVVSYRVTLVEGLKFHDYLVLLAENKKVQSKLLGKSQAEQLALMGMEVDHPEGWFYPDTYQFTAGATDISILRTAHKKMQAVLQEEWQNREADLPYEVPYQALIMASVVEKETGVAHERPTIAGVFVRRLRLNMRLQTDPTVIYGLGEHFDGDLKRKHLKQPTPYNTYVIKGLPPTPIANPGRAAISAALNPAKGKSLYFVGKGDGTHYFSETLEEHNQAVNKYQRFKRAKDYRSSPPTDK